MGNSERSFFRSTLERAQEAEERATRLEREKGESERQLVEYMSSAPMPTEVERLQAEAQEAKREREEAEGRAREAEENVRYI